jgi:hypothetical protein
VVLRMQRSQTLARDVRIDRCRRNIRMPKQQLHGPQVGAVVYQMRGATCGATKAR